MRYLSITLVTLMLIIIRQFDSDSHAQPLFLHGILDGLGHLLTAGIVAVGLAAWRRGSIPLWSLLLGGLAPDIGHALTALNLAEPIHGSSRNGTHSLMVVVVLLLLALGDRKRRGIWLGLGIGVATHLWRDLGTGAVPLLWPWSDRVFAISFVMYVAGTALAGLVLIFAGTVVARRGSKPAPDSFG